MPKYAHNGSPLDPDNEQAQINEITRRKKKNADAQAAFRQRQADYITTLEETVTNLESVLLQIQESYRELDSESRGWRERYERTRLEWSERENQWRRFWQSSQTSGDNTPLPPTDNTTAPLQAPSSTNVRAASAHQRHSQHSDQTIGSGNDDSSQPADPSLDQSSSTTASPSIPTVEPTVPSSSPDGRNRPLPKYWCYDYTVQAKPPRDAARWSVQQLPDHHISGTPAHQPSLPTAYTDPSSLAATDISCTPRPFDGAPETEGTQLYGMLDSAPYSFPNDDRYEPQLAGNIIQSTSPSSSPASMTETVVSGYSFAFPNDSARFEDRGAINTRRPHLSHVPRHPLGPQKSDSGPQIQYLSCILNQSIPSTSSTTGGAVVNCNSGAGGSCLYDRASEDSSLTQGAQHASARSSSPGPGPPSLSSTVAVIKAQSFGALRRTRAGRKPPQAAKERAKDALEARGIGLGVSANHAKPRPDGETLAMESRYPHAYIA